MALTRRFMLERARSRDRAYDGRFLTGVLSTGIYCLPSCPARPPREENVRFFATEGEARAAGLRPCLRCRPDDFLRGFDADLELAVQIAEAMRSDPAGIPDLATLGRRFALGASRLNAIFRRCFHASPGLYLQRRRMAVAAARLLAADERVLEVALGVGYDSLSAFHDAFRRATGMCPGDYRRLGESDELVVALPARFQPALTLRYLARDPESPSERGEGLRLARALRLPGGTATLHLELAGGAARCRVEPAPSRGHQEPGERRARMVAVHGIALRLLGLGLDPAPFERRLARAPEDRRLLAGGRGLTISQTPDVFEGLAWAIVGQQVNLPFAYRLRRRLIELCGTPAPGGLLAHPGAAAVARLDPADLVRRQFSRRKAEYLIDTARAIAGGRLACEELGDLPAERAEASLTALRGIGTWTAQYVLMRACGFADCVPVGDAGLRLALMRHCGLATRPDADETRRRMQPFAPFRSLATFHLWRSLSPSGVSG